MRRLIEVVAVASFGVLVFCAGRWWVHSQFRNALERRALDVASTLRTGLATPIEALLSLRDFLETPRPGGLSHAQFQAYAKPALARHGNLVALEWFPLVTEGERPAFREYVRGEQPGFELREPTRAGAMVPAIERERHVPLTYAEPLAPAVHGLDIAFDVQRVTPVWRALETGAVTLSDRYQLVEDSEGVFSVVAYAPVDDAKWISDPAVAGSSFSRGVAVALFRLSGVVEAALTHHDLSDVVLRLEDLHAPSELRFLYESGRSETPFSRAVNVEFVDKQYRLTVTAKESPSLQLPLLLGAIALLVGAGVVSFFEMRDRAQSLARNVQKLGQYHLERRIGQGGMGTVYLARHALLRRPTAIKIARAGIGGSLEKEVLRTCELSHPNTIAVYDFGQGQDGSFYYAMEYIEGYNLDQLVQLSGPVAPSRVVRLLLQIAGSLDEAHSHGMVHRDIKPSNIMLTQRGGISDFIKVLDFGLAKRHQAAIESGAYETQPSVEFAGTPGYAAPELVSGKPPTRSCDVFALGAVGYFLLAGRAAFRGKTAVESLAMVVTDAPAPLPETVPRLLSQLILDCLAKQPKERPATMRVVAERLNEALTECPPWTAGDADLWWDEHPPAGSVSADAESHSFLVRPPPGSSRAGGDST